MKTTYGRLSRLQKTAQARGDSYAARLDGSLFAKRWQAWLAAFFLLVLAWLVCGYQVFVGNHALQLTLVERLNDPQLFPHDPFADTLTGYSAPIWWVVAWLARYLPLQPLLFGLFLAVKSCLLLAAAALSGALQPRSKLAPWLGALVAALAIYPLVGSSSSLVNNCFEQTSASIPFFLWAFAALLRGRRGQWAVCAAVGTTLNPMYGLYALSYSAVCLLFLYRRQLSQWLGALALFGALAAPALFFAIRSSSIPAADESLWLAAAMVRFAHHLVPLSWGIERFVAFGALLTGVLFFIGRTRSDAEQSGRRWLSSEPIWCIGPGSW